MDESRATYKYTWASLRAVSRVHMVHKTSPCTIRLRLITRGNPLDVTDTVERHVKYGFTGYPTYVCRM